MLGCDPTAEIQIMTALKRYRFARAPINRDTAPVAPAMRPLVPDIFV